MKTHNFHATRAVDVFRGRTGLGATAGVGSLVGIQMVGTLGDGQVWVKDPITGNLIPGYVEDLGTAETDTTKRLAPDGTGGVDWVAESGGSGDFVLPGGSPVTISVNASTGNDVTGDGSVGTPYASITRALADIPTIVDREYTIDVADGTYREQVDLDRFVFLTYLDGVTDARIILTGNTTTPANCIISGATSGAPTTPVRTMGIWARNGARAVIEGFSLQYAVTRGLQVDYYSIVTLGNMEYAHNDAVAVGLHSLVLIAGSQTIATAATGILLTEYGRLNTDSGSRAITMTAISSRGLYCVESTVLLNAGDSLSIAAAGSGSRPAGIECDGNAIVDIPVTVAVTGAFAYSIVAVAGGRIHVKLSSLTTSGASTAAYFANDYASVWDVDAPGFLAGAPAGGSTGFATPAIVLGTAAAAGSATTAVRTDATIVAFDTTAPAAIGTAAAGSVAKAARRDHVHPTGAGTPSTSAIGDAAATGSGPAAAMTDHVHGREALSTATPLVESGSGAVGTGTKNSREDHVHPAAAAGGVGPLLLSNSAGSPVVFGDILQNEAQTDLMYADP